MQDTKAFQIRMPKETWVFLKKKAVDQERSMNDLILSCVEKFKKRYENKLTDSDTNV